jgi:hypothetical protein
MKRVLVTWCITACKQRDFRKEKPDVEVRDPNKRGVFAVLAVLMQKEFKMH